jgi:hypothetical protein
MATEFYFTPELHLKDGRIIRDLDDAASFAREQEVGQESISETKSCTGSNARRARKRPMLQHISLCDGWKSWTFLNRAGPGAEAFL